MAQIVGQLSWRTIRSAPILAATRMNTAPDTSHLHIGFLIFPQIDQSDFTGPFEIFS
jgi:hypothetical protein